mgnify:FL=1
MSTVPSSNHSNCSVSVPGDSRSQTPTPLLTVAVRGWGVLVEVGGGVDVAVGEGEVGLGSTVEVTSVAVGTSVAARDGAAVSCGRGAVVGSTEDWIRIGLMPIMANKMKASNRKIAARMILSRDVRCASCRPTS